MTPASLRSRARPSEWTLNGFARNTIFPAHYSPKPISEPDVRAPASRLPPEGTCAEMRPHCRSSQHTSTPFWLQFHYPGARSRASPSPHLKCIETSSRRASDGIPPPARYCDAPVNSLRGTGARALSRPGRCHRKSIPNNKQVIRNPSQYYMLIRMAVEDLVPPSPKRNTSIPSCCKILHGLAVAPTSPPAPSAPLQRHPESRSPLSPRPPTGGRTLVLFWNVLNGTLSAQ